MSHGSVESEEGLDQVAADFPSAATWCQLLDSFKHPPLPYEA